MSPGSHTSRPPAAAKAGAALVALAALLLSGCPCDPGHPELFHDRLEARCGELPCDWERLAGDVLVVTTWHAGEHALRLSGGARLTRHLPPVAVTGAYDGFLLAAAVECEGTATLSFAVEVDAGGEEPLRFAATAQCPADGDEVVEPCVVPVRDAAGAGPETLPTHYFIERLEIEQTGDGACVVDDVRILSGYMNQCMG